MSTSAPFEVTPEALEVIAHLLQQHPEMQAGLMLVPSLEFDDPGTPGRFERETFWMAYDPPGTFSQGPRVELCGQSVPIDPDALERLRDKTLTLEAHDGVFDGAKLLVAAAISVQATPDCARCDFVGEVPGAPDRGPKKPCA